MYILDTNTLIYFFKGQGVHGPGHVSAELAVSCGDYLIWRFKKAFSYR